MGMVKKFILNVLDKKIIQSTPYRQSFSHIHFFFNGFTIEFLILPFKAALFSDCLIYAGYLFHSFIALYKGCIDVLKKHPTK